MQKKQKYNRMPEEDNELTYSQEVMAQQQEPTEVLDAEEESYKKRYVDIQRHIQEIRNQKDEKSQPLKNNLMQRLGSKLNFLKLMKRLKRGVKNILTLLKSLILLLKNVLMKPYELVKSVLKKLNNLKNKFTGNQPNNN